MRRQHSSYAGEINAPVENLVDRDFSAVAPNTKWLTDITEFRHPQGKVYLSPMIHCFAGLNEKESPVVQSERGSHYRWPGWIARMEQAGLTRSMSKKGCTPDNAACEGFFGRLTNEMYYNRSWVDTSIGEFIEVNRPEFPGGHDS
jgi:transposase InsO family protein